MPAKITSLLARTLGVMSMTVMTVNGAIADSTPMNGGMMGNGNWYGSGGVWLPALLIVVLGVVLFAVLRKKN
jgi:hypothetical protein